MSRSLLAADPRPAGLVTRRGPATHRLGAVSLADVGVVIGLVVVGVALPALLASSLHAFSIPRNDDWAYRRVLWHFVQTGNLSFVGWARDDARGPGAVGGPFRTPARGPILGTRPIGCGCRGYRPRRRLRAGSLAPAPSLGRGLRSRDGRLPGVRPQHVELHDRRARLLGQRRVPGPGVGGHEAPRARLLGARDPVDDGRVRGVLHPRVRPRRAGRGAGLPGCPGAVPMALPRGCRLGLAGGVRRALRLGGNSSRGPARLPCPPQRRSVPRPGGLLLHRVLRPVAVAADRHSAPDRPGAPGRGPWWPGPGRWLRRPSWRWGSSPSPVGGRSSPATTSPSKVQWRPRSSPVHARTSSRGLCSRLSSTSPWHPARARPRPGNRWGPGWASPPVPSRDWARLDMPVRRDDGRRRRPLRPVRAGRAVGPLHLARHIRDGRPGGYERPRHRCGRRWGQWAEAFRRATPGAGARLWSPERAAMVASISLAAVIALVAGAVTVNADAYDGARWRGGELAVTQGSAATTVDAGFEWVGSHSAARAVRGRQVPGDPAYESWYDEMFPGSRDCAFVRARVGGAPPSTHRRCGIRRTRLRPAGTSVRIRRRAAPLPPPEPVGPCHKRPATWTAIDPEQAQEPRPWPPRA